MSKYLEKSQLSYLWQKIKDYVDSKMTSGSSFTYSTSERWTGDYWIDGKKIYCKTVSLGAMPNNTTKYVAHGVTNIDRFIKIDGVAKASSNGNHLILPYVNFYNSYSSITFYVGKINIELHTGGNNSAYDSGYVILYYTKN